MDHLLKRKIELLADVQGKWEKSSWGRKLIVQKRRASLTDFDRFKVMLAKIKVSNDPSSCMHVFVHVFTQTNSIHLNYSSTVLYPA